MAPGSVEFFLQPWKFFGLALFSILLMASWLMPDTRSAWDSLDLLAFDFFNGWLSTDPEQFVNWFWAVFNVRVMDLSTLLAMTLIMLVPAAVFQPSERIRGFAGYFLLLILMLLLRELFDELVEFFDLNRAAPSREVPGAVQLSSLYPDMGTKDYSGASFPGDHATVLMLWLGYCLYLTRNLWSLSVLAVTLFFMLPRLVGGAHWLSDILVGGGTIAGFSLGLGLYTPLLNTPLDKLEAWLKALVNRCFPLLRPSA